MIHRLTVADFKKFVKENHIPDDALITIMSDEEGNSESVTCELYCDIVGRTEKLNYDLGLYTSGSDIQGIDLENDKNRVYVTIRPLY